jgi:predicted secreted protein
VRALLLASLAAALAGCADHHYPGHPEDPPRMLGEGDAARAIEMRLDKRITLRLEANHTTGHRWSLAASGDGALEQIGEPFYTAEKSVAGSGGAEYWTFRATRNGKAELRFEYRQPWERDKPAARTLSYTIDVR